MNKVETHVVRRDRRVGAMLAKALESAAPRSTELGLAAVAVAVPALLLAWSVNPAGTSLRERGFDALLARAAVDALGPVVVDVDRRALDAHGRWPWGHDRIAAILDTVAAANPRALGVDVLLDEPDQRSPAALARQLRAAAPGLDLVVPEGLVDGERALAEAVRRMPTVLGVALAPRPSGPAVRSPPILVPGGIAPGGLWRFGGTEAPAASIAEGATGFGVMPLPGGVDGAVRRVPLLALAGRQLVPGLALETWRVGAGGPPLLIDPGARTLRVGARTLPLGKHGLMRLLPVSSAVRAARRVSAVDVLSGDATVLERLAGAVVLLGATSPEVGGLRTGSDGALVASVDLHADAVAQIEAGLFPVRPRSVSLGEGAAIALGPALAVFMAASMAPLSGALAVGTLAALWALAAWVVTATALVLVDPVLPAAAALLAYALGALLVAARARRRAARVLAAFEQHLAPAVVRRIASRPADMRLEGEERDLTALFTDIEGFAATTAAAPPTDLIALLDAYFDEVSAIVVAHEGMIAKMIGDSMHALFNVPLDVADHPAKGVACAAALARACEAFIARPDAAALGLGRTRIGLETGPAIVGDVGGPRRLDYSAYGDTVNAASRYEAANKRLGTTVLIGPGTVSCVEPDAMMPLGRFVVRGLPGTRSLHTFWPDRFTPSWRERHRTAVARCGVMQLDELDPPAYRALLTACGAPS
ncbi:CHASE2 domain-containing protein [Acuticoccus sp.]|uniref:CHASE2 domain-containing protein n=1 Tax=Acuticoccus sp. TaxID=1904378 RepID=UPI003B52B220